MRERVGRKRLSTIRSVSVAAATFRGRPGAGAGVVLQAALKGESACWVVQNLHPSVARVSVYVIVRFVTVRVHMSRVHFDGHAVQMPMPDLGFCHQRIGKLGNVDG